MQQQTFVVIQTIKKKFQNIFERVFFTQLRFLAINALLG